MDYDVKEKQQWYSNKDLFEMLQDLKNDLLQTRADLRKYNDLRAAMAELQKSCMTTIEDVQEIKMQYMSLMSKYHGKKIVEEGFLRWGGWIFGFVSLAATIYKLFK